MATCRVGDGRMNFDVFTLISASITIILPLGFCSVTLFFFGLIICSFIELSSNQSLRGFNLTNAGTVVVHRNNHINTKPKTQYTFSSLV